MRDFVGLAERGVLFENGVIVEAFSCGLEGKGFSGSGLEKLLCFRGKIL